MRIRLFHLLCVFLVQPLLHAEESGESESGEISDLEKRLRSILQLPVPGGEENPEDSGKGNGEENGELDAATVQQLITELKSLYARDSYWFFFHGAKVGTGYQRNILKSPESGLDARFVSAYLETSGVWMDKKVSVFNYYVSAERRKYDTPEEIPNEDLLLAYGKLSLGTQASSRFDSEATVLYLRQVLEDPLLQGAPSFLSLWSASMRTGISRDFKAHSLFFGLSYKEEFYDEKILDNNGAGLFARWAWRLSGTLGLKTELAYTPLDFPNRPARRANGFPVEGELLAVERFELKTRVVWKPETPFIKDLGLSMKLLRDWSAVSVYDRNFYAQISPEIECEWGNLVVELKGKINYRDYDERQTGFADPEKQWRLGFGGEVSLEYTVVKDFVVEARYEFNEADSNRASLEYVEDSVELLARFDF